MKNTIILKTATILSYLVIIFPGSKISIINVIVLFGNLIQYIFMIGIEPFNINMTKLFVLGVFTILSLCLMLIYSKKLLILSCILIQYMWLINFFESSHIKYWYYTLPTLIYLVLSLILLYSVFIKKNQNQAIDYK